MCVCWTHIGIVYSQDETESRLTCPKLMIRSPSFCSTMFFLIQKMHLLWITRYCNCTFQKIQAKLPSLVNFTVPDMHIDWNRSRLIFARSIHKERLCSTEPRIPRPGNLQVVHPHKCPSALCHMCIQAS